MTKKLILLLVFISSLAYGQNYIKGTFNPKYNYTWVSLYQLKGINQKFVSYSNIENGIFQINFQQNASAGMYRLLFDTENGGFIDFIYNNENITVQFDPTKPLETLQIIESEENKIYNTYLAEISKLQHKLDSLQLIYFAKNNDEEKNSLIELYKQTHNNYTKAQKQFEQKSENKLAFHFIKSNQKFYTQQPIETPQEYLNSEKEHFFDYVDFSDKALLNSIFLLEKVVNYIFYLNSSEDIEMQQILYKNAVNEVMQKVEENIPAKAQIAEALLHTFTQIENVEVAEYIIETYYNKLPDNYKKETVLNDALAKLKFAIGKTVPEITWEENGVTKSLFELTGAENYILVFWSTTCSHCLNEIPKLYEFTKDNSKIHVIAYALEDNDESFKTYSKKFMGWTTILGLNKWENTTAKTYEINATPTYFILDKNKRIVAKPDHLEDVKAFFEN